MLAKLVFEVAQKLAHAWNDVATSTPGWLSAALDFLEESPALTPGELALRISKPGGIITPEQLSHRLKKYGIKSHKEGGKRVFSVSLDEIERIRKRYNIAKPEKPKLLAPPAGSQT